MTTVSDGLYQWGGVPVLPGGVPFGKNAKYYFVDPANGSDDNSGTSPEEAFAGLATALTRPTSASCSRTAR